MSEQNITPNQAQGQGESPAPAPEGYRRLEVGEIIQEGDYVWPKQFDGPRPPMKASVAIDATIEVSDLGYFFRPIPPTPQSEAKPRRPKKVFEEMTDAHLRVISENPNRPDQADAQAELFRRYPPQSGIETAILPRPEAPAICSQCSLPVVQEGEAKGGVDLEAVKLAYRTVGVDSLAFVLGSILPLCAEIAALRASNESLRGALRELVENLECHQEASARCEAGGNDGADVYEATEAFKRAIAYLPIARAALSPVSTGGASHG